MINRKKILAGKKIINTYRKNRYEQKKENQPLLLKIMVDALKELGFISIDNFFDNNNKLNLQTFKECYKIEGYCSHKCHGITSKMSKGWGCLETWYQEHIAKIKDNSEPLLTIEEAYGGWYMNPPPHLPPACTYKIVKVKECDLDWQWK